VPVSDGRKGAGAYRISLFTGLCRVMNRTDLMIEPYDVAEHERLISEHPLSSAWETPT
jgi:hypothetical protein